MAKDLIQDRTRAGIGYRLKLTREALGYDQGDFARGAGIAPNTYNQYEMGKNLPSLEMAHKLRDAYRLSLDWIFCGDIISLRRQTADAINSLRKCRSPE